MTTPQTRLRLGVISAEFFDLSLGRRGGFGKITQTVAQFFRDQPHQGVDITLLHGFQEAPPAECKVYSVGMPVLLRPIVGRSRVRSLVNYRALTHQAHLHALLTIDFYPSFRRTLIVLPRTPVIVWAHDPRTRADWMRIATLRVPGVDGTPKGVLPVDCSGFSRVVRVSRWLRRPLLLAAPATFIADKIADAYGIHRPEVSFLPVFLDFTPGPIVKSERPRVIFLGRLDPIKRPWLFVECARAMPSVEFVCVGMAHWEDHGGWEARGLPSNLHMAGHLDGAPKVDLLASAWALVNTSIHEALPMSFLEALACQTPIVSCQEAGGLTSRFGVYTGRFDGTGMEAVPLLIEGIQRLVDDTALRTRLGQEGREWVEATHTAEAFTRGLRYLLQRVGVGRER